MVFIAIWDAERHYFHVSHFLLWLVRKNSICCSPNRVAQLSVCNGRRTAPPRDGRAAKDAPRAEPDLLSSGPCSEKCGGPSPIFPRKKLATFFAHHSRSLGGRPLFRYFGHAKKFAAPFVGPLFGRTCWTCPNPPLLSWQWCSTMSPSACIQSDLERGSRSLIIINDISCSGCDALDMCINQSAVALAPWRAAALMTCTAGWDTGKCSCCCRAH